MSAKQSETLKGIDPNLETLLEAVIKATPSNIANHRRDDFIAFLPPYFNSSHVSDLELLNAEDLNGLALSHWQLLLAHKDNSTSLRILNPVIASDGWQSPNTIIELITTDQPHLVASIRSALLSSGHSINLIIHPVLHVGFDATGSFASVNELSEQTSKNGQSLSVMHVQISHIGNDQLKDIEQTLRHTLATLSAVKSDNDAMHQRLDALSEQYEIEEPAAFLNWLSEKQFTTFGIADVNLNGTRSDLPPLGLFSDFNAELKWDAESLIPTGTKNALAKLDHNLILCKTDERSPIIRSDYADLILLLHRKSSGDIVRISCIVGLFVSALQDEAPDSIPLVRERIEKVIDNSHFAPESHDGKALSGVLRGFPRDMLLQTPTDNLLKMAERIVSLHERQQIRLFHSVDPMGRFCNCLVYIPRDKYSRELRLDIESILTSIIDGKSTQFHTEFSSESALARLHFVVQKNLPLEREIDWKNIESRIQHAAITWDDRLLVSLREKHQEPEALDLYRRYSGAFPAAYLEDYSARIAVSDIAFIQNHVTPNAPVMSFYRHIVADTGTINFKLFAYTNPVTLSDVMPIIENMGLRVEAEHPFEVKAKNAAPIWIHEFTVEQIGQSKLDPRQSAEHIQQAFTEIWNGNVENDGFNRLILAAGLTWRQVVVLRSYCKYLLQIGVPFSQAYMIDSLVANDEIAADIVELFEQRFNPELTHRATEPVEQRILGALDAVASLDEDRILRAYLNLIQSTMRTNVYRNDSNGDKHSYLSFKFDSSQIGDLPLPHPMAEIFVYSPHFEGIHLRGGKVARGGLRWSDRREDFRTEVLGLMKAQMVKNAVIVPVGSKGGFYVKRSLSTEREEMMQQVVGCYQNFLRGLLDITDNIVQEKIVAPVSVVRYDEDDPYLVVAADKGTATFSDFANEVSAEYHFWLGDAFASGGSVGYDHKKMGITARGAWESVKRHFRELGHDTQTQPFTVAGIGDMAGDVFGNGMLLSEHIQLVAAFNHMHIFIDPTPDTSSSFKERQRLFDLPRSSWTDYDTALLSTGGGVYSRTDKSITLSPEACAALGVEQNTYTPTQLISVILRAPVDLLWNGGIGTYMKASTESHSDAADRANDNLRVNASELRCRVFGEGGNLGCTQLGRIEFARAGGMIYTDAIDNSAGVDCSDHEVNIKILVNSVVANDDMTLKQRDSLLADMTEEVGLLVLRDNYLQTQCINQCIGTGGVSLDEAQRFMQHLESIDRLNRSIEFLPENEELADRMAAEQGLSRPEIAVLVSYSKMVMYDDLLASDFAQEPALQQELMDYFPLVLAQQHGERIATHRLRSEIICTVVTNELVNRLGPTFAFRMQHELGASPAQVAEAFVAVRAIFHLPELWQSIESLDNKASAEIQNQMQLLVRGLAERSTHWLLRSRRASQSIEAIIANFEPGIAELTTSMPDCLAIPNRETLEQRMRFFVNADVPEATAKAVAQVVPLSSSLDIIEIASSSNTPVSVSAKVYFELGDQLELQWLREQIGELQVRSHWHTLSKSELRSDLHYQQRHLTAEVISSVDEAISAEEMVQRWAKTNFAAVNKYSDLIMEMKASNVIDFAMLSLAVNEVHKLLSSDRPLAAT